jgi:hypothetical protein
MRAGHTVDLSPNAAAVQFPDVASGPDIDPEEPRMCLFFSLLLFGPRLVGLIWWLVDPVRWNLAFGGLVVPILGIVFLPWTTVTYVVVAPGGVIGFDFLWLALAFVIDLSSYGAGAARRRRDARRAGVGG